MAAIATIDDQPTVLDRDPTFVDPSRRAGEVPKHNGGAEKLQLVDGTEHFVAPSEVAPTDTAAPSQVASREAVNRILDNTYKKFDPIEAAAERAGQDTIEVIHAGAAIVIVRTDRLAHRGHQSR